jgi:hypothetical protein
LSKEDNPVAEDYNELITAMIRKFMTLIKKETTIEIANSIDGLEVDDAGNVISLTRDGSEVFAELYRRFKEIGGGIAKIFARQVTAPIAAANPGLFVPEELR